HRSANCSDSRSLLREVFPWSLGHVPFVFSFKFNQERTDNREYFQQKSIFQAANMRISFFSTSLKFSGGRMTMFRHANELACRGHEVSLWIHTVLSKIDWMEFHVPVQHFTRASLGTLPAAHLCIFDRVRLAPLLYRAGLGKVVHLCQGFEGTD